MANCGMPNSQRNQKQKKIRYITPRRRNRNKIYLAIGIIAVVAVVIKNLAEYLPR